ncbi:MAG: hypothetical protein KA163_09350 [Bacteroidia bacterium]|nr:hypothetical protein [Bacteroidia bacterium]
MKKIFLSSLLVLGLGASIIVVSCKEKNNDNITPTYRNQSTGTGANPCLPCVTVTGTTTVSNPATQNSSLLTGGSGWSYNACATSPNTLTGFNGGTQVQILFGGGPIVIGTYAFTSGIPTAGQARMTVTSAPGQPSDITWYSKSGSVTTNTTGTGGYTATYSNVGCVQLNYLFPMVSVTGTLICN